VVDCHRHAAPNLVSSISELAASMVHGRPPTHRSFEVKDLGWQEYT